MKKIISILVPAAAAMILAVSCNKVQETPSQPAPAEKITIKASLPESTKVEFESDPSTHNLHLLWSDGDNIRVFAGNSSELFEIKDGFSDQQAEFTGNAVSGSKFSILYPGDYTKEEEAWQFNMLLDSQTQNGNGNYDHLRYVACLQDVDSYEDFTFSKAWATAHGGTFYCPGVIKVIATLPDGVTTLKQISVSCASLGAFSLALKNVDVSSSSQVLTAYVQTPWGDVELPAKEDIAVTVTASDDAEYSLSFQLDKATTLQSGHVSVFKFTKGFSTSMFAGGDGTQASPYIIKNAKHMQNMHEVVESGKTIYFVMDADVDLSASEWGALNATGNYDKGIFFDGQNHTVKGLKGSGNEYPSFAGVLNGTIKNVVFEGAVINAGSTNTGVVAGYIGTVVGSTDVVGICENVTVKDATITATATKNTRNLGGFAGVLGSAPSTITNCHVIGNNTFSQTATSYTGCSVAGFIGNVNAAGTITNCTAKADVNNPGSYYTAGFIGQIGAKVSAQISNCAFLGGTIFSERNSVKNSPVAGFIGRVTSDANALIENCYVDGAVINAVPCGRVGGFLGDSGNGTTTFRSCYVKNTTISGAQHCGGFAGVLYTRAEKCYVESTTVNANDINNGGFVGYLQKAVVTNCYTSANVEGGTFSNIGGFAGNCLDLNTVTCCYESGSVSGSATSVGAFVGGATDGYDSAKATVITKCIAWNGSLPFYGEASSKVVDEETLNVDVSKYTDNYCGNTGTISQYAVDYGWDTSIWNLSGTSPVLK